MAEGVAVADSNDLEALRARVAELEAELDVERRLRRGLKHSEDLYRRLVELSPDAIYVHDDHRRIVFINAAGARLFGAESPDQLIGCLATSLVHPDSRPSVHQHLDRVLSRRSTAVHQEQRRLRLDGSNFYADVVVAAIDWDDRPAGLVVVRDVSERIEARARAAAAEGRSREAYSRLAAAIEAMSGGFALYDSDERLVMFNRHYAEVTWPQCADFIRPGITFEALVQETLRRGVWDAAGERKEALAAAALERHRNLPSACEIAYPDGHWLWQSKQRTSDGGVVAVYADITDAKRREHRLREREEQLRSLLEALPDAVIIHVDERVVFVNAAAVRLFGADSAEQLLQSYSLQLVPPDFVASQRERRRQVLEGKRTLAPVEQQRYRLDGSLIHVETASTFMLWDGKHAFVGVLRDITGRKKAEDALAEAHRRFSAITANIPGAVFQRELADDGTVSFPYVSAGVSQITGFEADEVMADPGPFEAAIREDFRDEYYRRLRESAQTLAPFDVEIPIRRKDGEERWLRSRGKPQRRADGVVVWDGMFVDITDRKRIQDDARRAHDLLLEAIESMPDGFLLWNPEDRLVMWNKKYREFNPAFDRLREGMAFEEVMAVFYERHVRERGPEFADRWLEERRRQQSDATRIEIVPAIGHRWLRIGKRRTPEGFTVSILTDVTEQVQAAERLRESEERYRKLIDLTPDCIYVHKAGRIVVCNEAAVALFRGRQREDLIGMQTSELVHPDFRDIVARRQGLAVTAGTHTSFMRQKRLRLDGTEFWAEVAAAGVEWDGVRSGIVVLRDVTEQMRSEELLRRSKEDAELASRAKTEFLANISHELRTPLNAIIGFSDIIQRELFGPLGNDNYRSYIRDIYQSGTHLHDVINDILDLSKIEAGKLELQEEEVDIGVAVTRCLRVVQPRAEAGRIALTTTLQPSLPALRADERKMKQILLNLLSNAVKFTEPGGAVNLAATCTENGALEIVVSDTGIGMDADGIKAALQLFGQVDSALNRKYEGTGLGLPLTRALVELHGGSFEIDSALGEGTRVTVRLPADRVLAAPPSAARQA